MKKLYAVVLMISLLSCEVEEASLGIEKLPETLDVHATYLKVENKFVYGFLNSYNNTKLYIEFDYRHQKYGMEIIMQANQLQLVGNSAIVSPTNTLIDMKPGDVKPMAWFESDSDGIRTSGVNFVPDPFDLHIKRIVAIDPLDEGRYRQYMLDAKDIIIHVDPTKTSLLFFHDDDTISQVASVSVFLESTESLLRVLNGNYSIRVQYFIQTRIEKL